MCKEPPQGDRNRAVSLQIGPQTRRALILRATLGKGPLPSPPTGEVLPRAEGSGGAESRREPKGVRPSHNSRMKSAKDDGLERLQDGWEEREGKAGSQVWPTRCGAPSQRREEPRAPGPGRGVAGGPGAGPAGRGRGVAGPGTCAPRRRGPEEWHFLKVQPRGQPAAARTSVHSPVPPVPASRGPVSHLSNPGHSSSHHAGQRRHQVHQIPALRI